MDNVHREFEAYAKLVFDKLKDLHSDNSELSKKVDADLITIMNLADETVLGLFENSFQEEIVANDLKIPVLCVNPHSVTKVSGILVR